MLKGAYQGTVGKQQPQWPLTVFEWPLSVWLGMCMWAWVTGLCPTWPHLWSHPWAVGTVNYQNCVELHGCKSHLPLVPFYYSQMSCPTLCEFSREKRGRPAVDAYSCLICILIGCSARKAIQELGSRWVRTLLHHYYIRSRLAPVCFPVPRHCWKFIGMCMCIPMNGENTCMRVYVCVCPKLDLSLPQASTVLCRLCVSSPFPQWSLLPMAIKTIHKVLLSMLLRKIKCWLMYSVLGFGNGLYCTDFHFCQTTGLRASYQTQNQLSSPQWSISSNYFVSCWQVANRVQIQACVRSD